CVRGRAPPCCGTTSWPRDVETGTRSMRAVLWVRTRPNGPGTSGWDGRQLAAGGRWK
ncbi:2-oxoglutarate-4-dioxygenase subunit alpha-1), partial [Durusdinium trenchii]